MTTLLTRAARNDEVGGTLRVSVRTNETHLGRIQQKLGVRGRVALTAWWSDRMP